MKAGRPTIHIKPVLKLTKKQRLFIDESLKKHNAVRLDTIGILTVRSIKARKLYHNFSDKVITIKAHKRLHLVGNICNEK